MSRLELDVGFLRHINLTSFDGWNRVRRTRTRAVPQPGPVTWRVPWRRRRKRPPSSWPLSAGSVPASPARCNVTAHVTPPLYTSSALTPNTTTHSALISNTAASLCCYFKYNIPLLLFQILQHPNNIFQILQHPSAVISNTFNPLCLYFISFWRYEPISYLGSTSKL